MATSPSSRWRASSGQQWTIYLASSPAFESLSDVGRIASVQQRNEDAPPLLQGRMDAADLHAVAAIVYGECCVTITTLDEQSRRPYAPALAVPHAQPPTALPIRLSHLPVEFGHRSASFRIVLSRTGAPDLQTVEAAWVAITGQTQVTAPPGRSPYDPSQGLNEAGHDTFRRCVRRILGSSPARALVRASQPAPPATQFIRKFTVGHRTNSADAGLHQLPPRTARRLPV